MFEAGNGSSRLKRAIDGIASLKVTTVCLLFLFGIVLGGTFFQATHGIAETQAVFFHSWLIWAGPIPFPGGQLVFAVLAINLLVSLFARIPLQWSKAGLILSHAGLVVLVAGSLVGRFMVQESVISLREGESARFSTDPRQWEIEVGGQDSFRLPIPDLPDQIAGVPVQVLEYHQYAAVSATGDDAIRNASGWKNIAQMRGARGEPVPGIILQWGAEKVLLHGADQEATITNNGTSLRLRPSRHPLPAVIHLTDFTAEFYPGTSTPRSFTSELAIGGGDAARSATVSMNQPLRLANHTIYQLAYDQSVEGPSTSVLQVVKNPVRWFPYVVTLLISGGLLLHLIIVLANRQRSVSN